VGCINYKKTLRGSRKHRDGRNFYLSKKCKPQRKKASCTSEQCAGAGGSLDEVKRNFKLVFIFQLWHYLSIVENKSDQVKISSAQM
jgi:hypothetical protein